MAAPWDLALAVVGASAGMYSLPLLGGADLPLTRVLALAGMVAWVGLRWATRQPLLPTRLSAHRLMGLLLAYAAASAVGLSENPRAAAGQVVGLAFGGLLLLWLPQAADTPQRLLGALRAGLGAGLVLAVFAHYQTVSMVTGANMRGNRISIPGSGLLGMASTWLALPRAAPYYRLTLPFGTSSHLAPWAAALCLLLLGLALAPAWPDRTARYAAGAVCGLVGAILVGALSRGAWIGFAAGLATMFKFARSLTVSRRTWRLVAVLLVLAVLVMALLPPKVTGAIVGRLSQDDAGDSDRLHWLFRAWAYEQFAESPLWGIGWGNYEARTGVLHSHSQYATILAEGGIIGLGLWLALCGAVLRCGILAVRANPPGSAARWLSLGCLGAWVSLLVGNLFQQYGYFGYYWLVAGLVLACYGMTRQGVAAPDAV